MTIATEVETTAAQLAAKTPQEIIAWALDKYHPQISLASSFGAEDVVLIDMLAKIRPDARVFTLDTGRLPTQTYDVIEAIQRKYPQLQLQIMFPDTKAVQEMVQSQGINLFYDSIENRKKCCYVRKVEPLNRALAGLDAWFTGCRSEQTANRADMQVVEVDEDRGIVKVNPLLNWTEEQVWQYIRKNFVPYNALHDQNYPSIGCAPCTRAIKPDEDPRAGRWWWEQGGQECGLHVSSVKDLAAAKS
jgi:phosphoadenosine phosphosulfate reductase